MPRLQKCPAINELNESLNVFPNLRRDILVDVRPGTRHTSGLAIDIFFNANLPQQKKHALSLIDVLVKHQKAMQWSGLIFTDFFIGGGVGGFLGNGEEKSPYRDDTRHFDHIHLDWVDLHDLTGPKGSPAYLDNPYNHPNRSKNTSWCGALEADFRILASSWTPGSANTQWLVGWWKVWDGNTYYYFFDSDGDVQYTKTRPTNVNIPPSRPNNTGTYTFASSQLILTWNKVQGAEAACRETFYNAIPGCQQMNANSNLYSPLVATRKL